MPYKQKIMGILGQWKTGFGVSIAGLTFSITLPQVEIWLRVAVLIASLILTLLSIRLRWKEGRRVKADDKVHSDSGKPLDRP